MLAVSFDERKNLYRANQLLKIFNCSETIKETMNESLSNIPKKSIKNFNLFRSPSF